MADASVSGRAAPGPSTELAQGGGGWQLALLLLGLLSLVAAGGLFAWRKGRLLRWLPAPVRALLGGG